MFDDKWDKLRLELLKDYWTDSQVCHIFAGLLEITKDGKYDCVEIEQEGLRDAKKSRRDQLREIWEVTDHRPRERENYYQSITKYWKTTYCVRWAQEKQIDIPWLDWAIEEKYIKAEDLVPENDNTDADHVPEKKPMGEKKEENLHRLFSIMTELMVNPDKKSDFRDPTHMITHIQDNYETEVSTSVGLSKETLNRVLAKARKIRPIKEAGENKEK